ncbi:DUF6020 family protein [Bifidobacterium sp. ESL0769]|uniref:DUF6020 family protein n=1 Tax=Bifidobacterium sp. ESL0769 TaxID=2983229 RepID=UPI0023F70E05|nr:DUF6020 family protein [Bifidobacterium sp. ESL0769]WEV67118.1 DUF6020 family protein [Bifidobacterium sp. ESL0769]
MSNPNPANAASRQDDGKTYLQGVENARFSGDTLSTTDTATTDTGSNNGSIDCATNNKVAPTQAVVSAKTAAPTHFGKLFVFLRWALAVAACLWIALCTSLGPLYRQYEFNPAVATIRAFSWNNAAIFAFTFAVCLLVIIELVRFGRGQLLIPYDFGIRAKYKAWRERRQTRKPVIANKKTGNTDKPDTSSANASPSETFTENDAKLDNRIWLRTRIWRRIRRMASSIRSGAHRGIMFITDKWWKIALILIIGWLWIPITLVAAFGADIRSQFREFSWAWNQWTGLKQPYIGFFSFVPMDIYPTAHYLWPSKPTYLTDQHNIVLTLIYGGAGTISRYFTGANDWGIAVLASGQLLFAAFCLAATANRFFNHPWLKPRRKLIEFLSAPTPKKDRPALALQKADAARFVGPLPRFFILLLFLVCPLVLFSTISLTKSPLFAFAFVWWFGVGYEILCTAKFPAPSYDRIVLHLRKRTFIALVLSTIVMMISAKYALYIILFELIIALIADHKRWKTYLIGILLPVILFQGAVGLAARDGAIINGDPIESHGVQLQQIARVAVLNPSGIPQDARNKLSSIFNLDQMAEAYFQQDADPVKSSGIQTKRVSYRWRTVTKADMKNFNAAWLEIVKANPRISLDALLAKSYGYFDIMDPPYIDMTYYVVYAGNGNFTDWIGNWCADWRKSVTTFVKNWSSKPVLGWLIHGNTYVIITLLLGAAEVILRRWKTLATHLPLLLLMGVMVTSPANNFERHMLPLVFVLGFVLLTFWQDSRTQRTQARLQRAEDSSRTLNKADKPDKHMASSFSDEPNISVTGSHEVAGLES